MDTDQRIRDALTQLLSQPDVRNTELVLALKTQLLSAEQRRQISVLLFNAVAIQVIADTTLTEPEVIEYLKRNSAGNSISVGTTQQQTRITETSVEQEEEKSSSRTQQVNREEVESIVQQRMQSLQESLMAQIEQEIAGRFEQRNNENEPREAERLQSLQVRLNQDIEDLRNRIDNELVLQNQNLSSQVTQLQQLTSDQNFLPRLRTEIDAAQLTAQFNERVTQQVQRICLKEKFIDITIGGSTDFLYPVWWMFPTGDGGRAIGRIMISRYFAWNHEQRPLDPNRPHQASLLLDIEGWTYAWGGDPHIFNILNFGEVYNGTVSHVAYQMKSTKSQVDESLPYGYAGDGDAYCCPCMSGCYLRGGGLTYRIYNNWGYDVQYSDGSSHEPITIYTSQNAQWKVVPIPWSERAVPLRQEGITRKYQLAV